jgi:integrase
MTTQQPPKTLSALLKTAGHDLWKGKAYERTAFRNVEEFIEVVGDIPLEKVQTTTMDQWKKYQWTQAKVSPPTVNRKLVNIKQVLRFAVDREWLPKMPVVKGEPEGDGRIRWITPEEEALMFGLLEKWGEHEVSKFILVAMHTGMRRGELLELKPSHIDQGWVRLWKTKTKVARSVPLTKGAQEALKDFKGWSIDVGDLRRVWKRLREAMGLLEDPDFVLHALRHTTATRLLEKTGNIAVVQKMLGHKKLSTTMRYAHVSDDQFRKAVIE